jgi:hypothetical protein
VGRCNRIPGWGSVLSCKATARTAATGTALPFPLCPNASFVNGDPSVGRQGSRGEVGGGQFGSGSGAAAADKPADKPAKKKGKKIESRDEFVEKGVALRMRTRDAHRASATASPQ